VLDHNRYYCSFLLYLTMKIEKWDGSVKIKSIFMMFCVYRYLKTLQNLSHWKKIILYSYQELIRFTSNLPSIYCVLSSLQLLHHIPWPLIHYCSVIKLKIKSNKGGKL
jgi:hypothetical protein